jgi:hypothetical protein
MHEQLPHSKLSINFQFLACDRRSIHAIDLANTTPQQDLENLRHTALTMRRHKAPRGPLVDDANVDATLAPWKPDLARLNLRPRGTITGLAYDVDLGHTRPL